MAVSPGDLRCAGWRFGPRYMGNIWEICGKYGDSWKIYRKYMGNMVIYGKYVGNIWEIYGKWEDGMKLC